MSHLRRTLCPLWIVVAWSISSCATTSPPRRVEPRIELDASKLPTGWSGVGVLARARKLPEGAPSWLEVVAEVKDDGGARSLYATAVASGIKNRALGVSTASNRARSELTRWLSTNTLRGAEIVDVWENPVSGSYGSRAKITLHRQSR